MKTGFQVLKSANRIFSRRYSYRSFKKYVVENPYLQLLVLHWILLQLDFESWQVSTSQASKTIPKEEKCFLFLIHFSISDSRFSWKGEIKWNTTNTRMRYFLTIQHMNVSIRTRTKSYLHARGHYWKEQTLRQAQKRRSLMWKTKRTNTKNALPCSSNICVVQWMNQIIWTFYDGWFTTLRLVLTHNLEEENKETKH